MFAGLETITILFVSSRSYHLTFAWTSFLNSTHKNRWTQLRYSRSLKKRSQYAKDKEEEERKTERKKQAHWIPAN